MMASVRRGLGLLVLACHLSLITCHWPSSAWAEVPQLIAYQGRFTERDGSSLTGDHTIVFRVYDVESGGQALWEETHRLTLTRDDNGIASIVLGSLTPLGSLAFTRPLWLAIAIDADGELAPRQRLTAVGYAINADTLDGLDSQQFVRVGQQAAMGPLAPDQLAAGSGLSVDAPGLSLLRTCATDQVLKWNAAGGAWQCADDANSDTGGTVTGVVAGAGLTGGGTSGSVTVAVDAGTTANKIVQLDASAALPAVSGANLTGLNASNVSAGMLPDARLSTNVSLLGASIDSAEIADGTIAAADLGADSIGASQLRGDAIQSGDIEVGDLPAHAGTHQPGGADAIPTASAVSIGTSNGAGTSTSLARADHVHQGVHSLAASGQSDLYGDITLSAGGNVTLTQSGQQISIAASTGGASGNRISTAASNSLAIGVGSDTTLLSVGITKSQAGSALLVLATVQLSHTANPNSKTVNVKLFRDSTQLDASYTARIGTANETVSDLPVTLQAWDTSGTGTYTFSLRAQASGGGASATVRRLSVIELP